MGDRQADWQAIHSGKERAELKGKALDFPVDLRSYPC